MTTARKSPKTKPAASKPATRPAASRAAASRAGGNRLEPVRLVDLGTVRGGLTVRPVVSPAFKPE